ncbi:MAG: SUMF1/EgtB/PvdO family nonheme iron enzyme, partial [Planctomycetota bacterium]
AAGNIWEWTDSWKDGRQVSRTIKGGAWDAPSSSLASAFAHSLEPFHRAPTVGFRCARSLPV